MQNYTRTLLNAYLTQIASLSGVGSAASSFAVAPTVQQVLETRMQDTSAFLNAVTVQGVRDLQGEKVGISVNGSIASRTETTGAAERVPRDIKSLASNAYKAEQTNYDTAIRYATLDAWAAHPDFETRLRDSILQQQALDRLCVGFNGVSVAATTNRATNPLLQDVNIGWLQQIRLNSPSRAVHEKVANSGVVKVGATNGDWKTLDALVYEMVNDLIDPWYREHPELRVIIGRGLHTDFVVPQIEEFKTPMEREALARLMQQSKIGGVPAVQVPFVPAGTILVTIPKNLAIYYQLGGRRRFIIDEPKKNQIANYESSNDAYVVEDYGCVALVENIQLV